MNKQTNIPNSAKLVAIPDTGVAFFTKIFLAKYEDQQSTEIEKHQSLQLVFF
jgi:hypothetical protein